MAGRPRVVVLDHGSGNLRSAERALVRAGSEVKVTGDAESAQEADGLVVPGVGAFATCMAGVQSVGAEAVIRRRVVEQRPVLGICVGMQLLFGSGDEHGVVTPGLQIWPGTVERLHADVLPHMGWNTVAAPAGSRLFAGLDGERFYFVHSYAVRRWEARSDDAQVTWAKHGERFVAAAEEGALAGTQFHPEKSGDAGAALLRHWVGSL